MRLIFLGAPGSGKGTHAVRVKADYHIPHISTGDIFRANIKGNTPLGQQAKAYLDKGALVPDELTIAIVKDRLANPDCAKGFILDGFPRTIQQADALATFAGVDAVINLILDDETIVERVTGRRMCACGATYNVATLKGATTCAKCGGELYQRVDDQPETVRNRLEVYAANTAPLIDYYRAKGLIKDVDSNGLSIDQVYDKIKEVLDTL
ncbi:MAG: adenylate kinase [Clostridia bacterium]|nr:adenylate kinase [Clostridia bacterium]